MGLNEAVLASLDVNAAFTHPIDRALLYKLFLLRKVCLKRELAVRFCGVAGRLRDAHRAVVPLLSHSKQRREP